MIWTDSLRIMGLKIWISTKDICKYVTHVNTEYIIYKLRSIYSQ